MNRQQLELLDRTLGIVGLASRADLLKLALRETIARQSADAAKAPVESPQP